MREWFPRHNIGIFGIPRFYGITQQSFNSELISKTLLGTESNLFPTITLPGFHPPECKYTAAEKGGTMLYVSKKLHYKPRKDLEIYAKKELESTFVEIINKKNK